MGVTTGSRTWWWCTTSSDPARRQSPNVVGELGLSKSPHEGVQWLKRSREHTAAEFPHVLHELALLHKCGIDNVVFANCEYTAKLLTQASKLSNAPSTYRLGECSKYGKMGCPQDPALSIHYYVHLRPSRVVSPS